MAINYIFLYPQSSFYGFGLWILKIIWWWETRWLRRLKMECIAFCLWMMQFIQMLLLLMSLELWKWNELVNHKITPKQDIICTGKEKSQTRLARIKELYNWFYLSVINNSRHHPIEGLLHFLYILGMCYLWNNSIIPIFSHYLQIIKYYLKLSILIIPNYS